MTTDRTLDYERMAEWLGLVTILWLSVHYTLHLSGIWSHPTGTRKGGGRASGLMAYYIVAGLLSLYIAVAGIVGWFRLSSAVDTRESQEDLYGPSHFVEHHILIPLFAYQAWNVGVSAWSKDLFNAPVLGHQVGMLLLALHGISTSFLHYWSLYFFGVVEISNIPLVAVSMLRCLREPTATKTTTTTTTTTTSKKSRSLLEDILQLLFAASFLVVRLIFWFHYISLCVVDCYASYIAGKVFGVVFVGFATCAAFLTILQVLWAGEIIKSVRDILYIPTATPINSSNSKKKRS